MQTYNRSTLPPQSRAMAAGRPATTAPSIVPTQRSTTVWRHKLEASRSDVLARLLQASGIVGAEQLCDAREIADSLQKSIDQVLATSFLSDLQIELCSAAISYVDRGIVTNALAVDGLRAANAKGVSFQEGLKYFGFGW